MKSRFWYDVLYVPVKTSLSRGLKMENEGRHLREFFLGTMNLPLLECRSFIAFSGATVCRFGFIISPHQTPSRCCAGRTPEIHMVQDTARAV